MSFWRILFGSGSITEGADVNAKDNNGDTALIRALIAGDVKRVKALIAAGADVNAKRGGSYSSYTALMSTRNAACIKALIAAGADVNAKNDDGNTALTSAAYMRDYAECVKALIAGGADVNARGIHGDTALISVSDNGDVDLVKALIAAGADVNAKNEGNWMALRLARKGMAGWHPVNVVVKPAYQDIIDALKAAGATE